MVYTLADKTHQPEKLMEFDLFDFDKTIFPYDSETIFLFYCLRKHPLLILTAPYLLFHLILFFLGFGSSHKGKCFAFLRFIDGEKEAEEFWKKNDGRIFDFFRKRDNSRPVVLCSASPEFLLKPFCEKYGIHTLVATRMDPGTGRIIGENCKDREKVIRLGEAVPDAVFKNVYSDNVKSDVYIFSLGEKCFVARHGTVTETPFEEIRKIAGKNIRKRNEEQE